MQRPPTRPPRPAGASRWLALLPALAACGGGEDDAIPLDGRVFTVDGVQVELVEGGDPALSSGAPVVVVVHGGLNPDTIPVLGPVTSRESGFVQIYLDLPGGEGTPGTDDVRGPEARAALATALRYAAGEVPDDDGGYIDERATLDLAPLPVMLHGQSNGGNLAVATLADPDLDLPEIGSLSTFETPISAQVVTVELGTPGIPNPNYAEGSCTWSAEAGMACAVDYADIGWDPTASREDGSEGAVFFDLDGDGRYRQGADLAIWGVRLPRDDGETLVFSPQLAAAVEERLGELPGLMPADEADAFWAEREASRQVAAMVERWPDLPVMVLGTAADHGSGAPDHPHVTGLVHALVASGAAWARLNPDAATMDDLLGHPEGSPGWTDYPANTPMDPGDPHVRMEPDEASLGLHQSDYVYAALTELARRLAHDDWSADLDAPLDP